MDTTQAIKRYFERRMGFEGFVVSDWFAVNERDAGLATGLELEMTSSSGIGDE